jgi:N-methylhydantoinase B
VKDARGIVNIELQVIGSALVAVAEEMGAALIRSAFSSNIKERRDCSTAIFDARGRMIAQAEHIPVHLGAMPEAVAAVQERNPGPGEIFAVNDPFMGGTHLPDITLVSRTEAGFAVSRAHHADVGGMEPSSLPAGSKELYQEGVIIPPTRLDDEVIQLLCANMRNPDERLGDLRAQLGAQRLAERRIEELCTKHGSAQVEAAMAELFAHSERMVRAGIDDLPDGSYEAEDVLEPAEPPAGGKLAIRVRVAVQGDEIEIDFEGTSPQHDGNLNCPLSVTRSACYFVVRCLTAPDIPASGGAYAPVKVTAPPGSLVNARAPAAVVAGNTETSSRITDVVFRALGQAVDVPAQGQGTMNNVTFGNRGFTYYETIGGGQGACAEADGPSAVHVAMSNALNTPIEALELAYPLRVRSYGLRLGSGGAGRRRGGDGVVRELEALEPCRLSLLTERRAHAPQGIRGGEAGACGRNLLNGQELPAKVTRSLSPGDVVRIETPGGGGLGTPES